MCPCLVFPDVNFVSFPIDFCDRKCSEWSWQLHITGWGDVRTKDPHDAMQHLITQDILQASALTNIFSLKANLWMAKDIYIEIYKIYKHGAYF